MEGVGYALMIAGLAICIAGNAAMLFTKDIQSFCIGSQGSHAGILVFMAGVMLQ